jgi:hypothetical protein
MMTPYIANALQVLYPAAIPGVDYLLQDDGNGPYIREWSLPDPVPSDAEIKIASEYAVKAKKWGEIKGERDRRKSGGVLVNVGGLDRWLHTDSDSKTQHLGNKDTARDQLASGGSMSDPLLDPETGEAIMWKTLGGIFIPMTCQLAFDIVMAIKSVEFSIFKAAEIHKVAMEASADPASYDYSSDWPLIYGE